MYSQGQFPTQLSLHIGLPEGQVHTSASVDGVSTIINGVITAAGWVSYIKPLIYFGSLGALGGFAFWVALSWSGTFGKAAAAADRSRASGAELRHAVRSALPDGAEERPFDDGRAESQANVFDGM